jgi:PAS domain S-box-containing protein
MRARCSASRAGREPCAADRDEVRSRPTLRKSITDEQSEPMHNQTTPGRLLIVARRAADRGEAAAALGSRAHGEIVEAASVAEALGIPSSQLPACVLLHLDVADCGVFEALARFAADARLADVPIVVLASNLGEDLCRDLIRAGAEDAVTLAQLRGGELCRAVGRAIERRRAALARELSRRVEVERARLAVANSDDGVWDWDVQTDRVYWSERWFRMLGYEPGAFTPSFESFIELVHPDDRARIASENERHNAGCTPAFESEFRMRCADGSYRWILSRAKSVYDELGRMVRVVGFHVDIDARRRAEQSVQRRNAGLELLNDGAAELLGTRDPDVVIENLFRRVAAFVGSDVYFHFRIAQGEDGEPELRLAMSSGLDDAARAAFQRLGMGQAVCGVTACERRPQYRPDLQRSSDVEAKALRALGLGVYSCYPLIVGDDLLGTLGFGARDRVSFEADERTLLEATARQVAAVLDRTRRESAERKADELRRASEQRYRGLADAVPLLVWSTDPEGRAIDFNQRWFEYTGLDLMDSIAFGWRAVMHPDDLERTMEHWLGAVRSGQRFEMEHRLRRASDGQYRWVLAQAVPVRDADGRVIRWFGASTDIHDQKLAETERERLLAAERAARIEADRAGRLKDEFLATISHELRTPLNSILGWARLLLRPAVQKEMYEEGIRVIERNAKVQAQLISDLLDVNRIVSGKLLLELDRVDVNDVAAAALETVQPSAQDRGVCVATAFARNLAPVRGDFARLQQVVWNLLANAIKFTPPNGRVDLETRSVAGGVEVEVRDSGQGIPEEFLPHVFDRFRQADGSTTRRHGGLGLGLAIVKQLVEMHGGEVAASSLGAGHGASFRIRLPSYESVEPVVSAETDARAALAIERQSLDGVDVLLVDDQTDALEFMRRLLAEHGARVRTATRAEEALEILKDRDGGGLPQLLVSDIGMPGMDGYELLKAVRFDLGLGPERLPAVAVTAFARDDDRRDAQAVGYQIHVTKPFQPDRLIAALGSLAPHRVAAQREPMRLTHGAERRH